MNKLTLLLGLLLIVGCGGEPRKYPTPKYKRGDSVIFKNDPALPMVVQQVSFFNASEDDPDSIEYKCKFRGMYTTITQTEDGPHETKVGFDTEWFYQYELEKYEIKGEYP